MLRIISEGTLEMDEKLFVCFVDWQKTFHRVKRTKLMQILKKTGIDWCEGNLPAISKLIGVLKYEWTRERQEV
jgi:hypothetical protein